MGIKLIHQLFKVVISHLCLSICCSLSSQERKDVDDPLGDDGLYSLCSISRLVSNKYCPDYPINDWPVSSASQPCLDDIKTSHIINQIPAYDIRDIPIAPTDYQEKLAGSIVEVYFMMAHFHIQQSQKNIFNAIVRDITILRPPLQLSLSTSRWGLHSALHDCKKINKS